MIKKIIAMLLALLMLVPMYSSVAMAANTEYVPGFVIKNPIERFDGGVEEEALGYVTRHTQYVHSDGTIHIPYGTSSFPQCGEAVNTGITSGSRGYSADFKFDRLPDIERGMFKLNYYVDGAHKYKFDLFSIKYNGAVKGLGQSVTNSTGFVEEGKWYNFKMVLNIEDEMKVSMYLKDIEDNITLRLLNNYTLDNTAAENYSFGHFEFNVPTTKSHYYWENLPAHGDTEETSKTNEGNSPVKLDNLRTYSLDKAPLVSKNNISNIIENWDCTDNKLGIVEGVSNFVQSDGCLYVQYGNIAIPRLGNATATDITAGSRGYSVDFKFDRLLEYERSFFKFHYYVDGKTNDFRKTHMDLLTLVHNGPVKAMGTAVENSTGFVKEGQWYRFNAILTIDGTDMKTSMYLTNIANGDVLTLAEDKILCDTGTTYYFGYAEFNMNTEKKYYYWPTSSHNDTEENPKTNEGNYPLKLDNFATYEIIEADEYMDISADGIIKNSLPATANSIKIDAKLVSDTYKEASATAYLTIKSNDNSLITVSAVAVTFDASGIAVIDDLSINTGNNDLTGTKLELFIWDNNRKPVKNVNPLFN